MLNNNAVKEKSRFGFTILRASAAITSLISITNAKDGVKAPMSGYVDVMNHISNFGGTLAACYPIGMYVGNTMLMSSETRQDPADARQARVGMAAAGMLVGLAVNTIFETRYGMRLVEDHSVADPIDFVYGVAGGVVGAALMPKLKSPSGQ